MEVRSIDPNSIAGASSDAALVGDAIAGRRDAFDELIRRHQRQAVAVSYRLLGNSQDALEVTQDAFLKAFASIKTLQKPAAFSGWLMRIVSNLSLNYRRGRKNDSPLPVDEIIETQGAAGDPLHALESRDMGRKLHDALAGLPEKQRLAIVMFAIEKMPQKDVAEALKCSVQLVKWHVFQGRKKLKELLREELEIERIFMNREDLEFQISQYIDGTLSVEETTALEKTLAADDEARQLLAEYHRLQNRLAEINPLPAVRWNRLADHLSKAVRDSEEPAIAGRIGWRSRLAIAASILIVITLGVLFRSHRNANVNPVEPTVIVTGPQAESPTGPAVEQITVGPSPKLAARADSWRYGEGVVTRPAHVELAGEVHPPTTEPHIH